jgi:hypothetical protein
VRVRRLLPVIAVLGLAAISACSAAAPASPRPEDGSFGAGRARTPLWPGAIPRHRSRQGNSRLTPALQIRRIAVRLPSGSSLAPTPAPPWPPRRGRPTRQPRRTRPARPTGPTGQVYRPRALADMPGDEALSKLRGRSAGPAVRSARLADGPVSPFPFTSLAMAGHGYTRTRSRHLDKHRGTGINAAGKGNAASAELAAPRAGSLNAVRLSPVDRRPSRSPAGTRPEAPRRP